METTELKPAEFSCHAPDAQAVFVAGTFNDWNPTTLPLDPSDARSGRWQGQKLECGIHIQPVTITR